jgi:integrase
VLGLEVNDVDFANATVTFRPNQSRTLKTKRSHRTIPLWPQLAEILRAYLKSSGRKSGLLFPSPFLDKPGMITDFRKALDAVAERTHLWKDGEIRSKRSRHTYCATRLQTLRGDKPVAVFTVSREMGHANTALVEQVYGHVGNLPHRSSVVEYRVQQHRAKLKTHLKLLKSA